MRGSYGPAGKMGRRIPRARRTPAAEALAFEIKAGTCGADHRVLSRPCCRGAPDPWQFRKGATSGNPPGLPRVRADANAT